MDLFTVFRCFLISRASFKPVVLWWFVEVVATHTVAVQDGLNFSHKAETAVGIVMARIQGLRLTLCGEADRRYRWRRVFMFVATDT